MANHSSSFAWKIPWTETSGGLQTLVQRVKSLPAMWETQVQSLGQEDPLEKEMAVHSSIFAWRIPMDRGDWQATVHSVPKSQMQLSNFVFTFI